MKQLVKNLTLYLSFTIALTACNSDNEDDYQDNILSGTEWVSTNLTPTPPPSTDVWINDTFKKILAMFPSLKYSIDKESVILKDTYTINSNEIYYQNTLNFSYNNTVLYKDLVYSLSIIKEIENEYKTYLIPNQECLDRNGSYVLNVESNGIFYYPIVKPQEKKLLLDLNNNHHNQFIKRVKVISERSDTVFQNKEVEIMNFKRNENEIAMYNNDVKFIGNLDKANWLIKLSQISPSLKELGNFKLKTEK